MVVSVVPINEGFLLGYYAILSTLLYSWVYFVVLTSLTFQSQIKEMKVIRFFLCLFRK